MNDPTEAKKPPYLYRYVGISGARWEHFKDLVLHRRLYFSSPANFNDPFDSVVDISSQGPAAELRAFFRELIARAYPKMKWSRREREVTAHIRRARDPQFMMTISRELQDDVNGVGLVCLSAKADVPLMWSHYAEAHAGVALEFQMAEHTFLRYAREVRYRNKYKPARMRGAISDLVDAVLFTKAKYWKYEAEWRVANHQVCNATTREMEQGTLSGIVLGCRVCDATEKRVRDLISHAPDPVRLLRAEKVPGTFGLRVRDAA